MTGVSVLMVSLRRSDKRLYRDTRKEAAEGKTLGAERAPPGRAMLIRGGFRCARLAFVCARTVKPRHRDAQQTVIHRELRAMMNDMVHHHPANARHARHGKNLFAAGK